MWTEGGREGEGERRCGQMVEGRVGGERVWTEGGRKGGEEKMYRWRVEGRVGEQERSGKEGGWSGGKGGGRCITHSLLATARRKLQ